GGGTPMKTAFRRIGRRLLWSLFVLWAVLTATFALGFVVPSDPARAMVGPHADAATIETVRTKLCLDRPIVPRYGCFVGRIARGDLGLSFRPQRPVAELLVERTGATAELAIAALLLQTLAGAALGALAAWRRGAFDRLVRAGAVVAQAAPPHVVGPALVIAF